MGHFSLLSIKKVGSLLVVLF